MYYGILEKMSEEELRTYAEKSSNVINAYTDIMYSKDSLIDMLFRISGYLKDMEQLSISLRAQREQFYDFENKIGEKYCSEIYKSYEGPVCESEHCYCPKIEDLDNAVSEFMMNEMNEKVRKDDSM